MERHEVIAVLESLANGVDPATGQSIPLDAFHSDTVGALSTAGALLKEDVAALATVRRNSRSNPAYPAAGAPWSEDEDMRLAQEHDSGMSVSQIAQEHGRTSGAITLRLIKLGRIDAASVKTRQRGVQAEAKPN